MPTGNNRLKPRKRSLFPGKDTPFVRARLRWIEKRNEKRRKRQRASARRANAASV